MKVFVDANILVSILNKEYPLFIYTSRIISLANAPFNYEIFTSPICLAIAFYFAEKKSGASVAKQKIALLSKHLTITKTDTVTVSKAIENAAVVDFEDGLEYYSAIESNCVCIVTENGSDFYFSHIEIINSRDFFEKYVLPNKNK